MSEPNASENGKPNQLPSASSRLSAQQAFIATRRAFVELEGMGISDFDIFNALADLFYERGEPEISQLMAEAAYKFYQKD